MTADQRVARRGTWQKAFVLVVLIAILPLVFGNLWVELRSSGRIYFDVSRVPAADVGLVLGTSRRLHGGYENPFFAARMRAAADLLRTGKVRHLLLSGDNRHADYDEPTDMRDALMRQGVPETALTLDYAGFRTLDSFARAKKVFGLNRLTIVTDDFHAARSVLLARHFDIEASAYCGTPVPLRWSAKTRLREVGARCKALLDLYVLHTQPRFLGERVTLPSD